MSIVKSISRWKLVYHYLPFNTKRRRMPGPKKWHKNRSGWGPKCATCLYPGYSQLIQDFWCSLPRKRSFHAWSDNFPSETGPLWPSVSNGPCDVTTLGHSGHTCTRRHSTSSRRHSTGPVLQAPGGTGTSASASPAKPLELLPKLCAWVNALCKTFTFIFCIFRKLKDERYTTNATITPHKCVPASKNTWGWCHTSFSGRASERPQAKRPRPWLAPWTLEFTV